MSLIVQQHVYAGNKSVVHARMHDTDLSWPYLGVI